MKEDISFATARYIQRCNTGRLLTSVQVCSQVATAKGGRAGETNHVLASRSDGEVSSHVAEWLSIACHSALLSAHHHACRDILHSRTASHQRHMSCDKSPRHSYQDTAARTHKWRVFKQRSLTPTVANLVGPGM